MAENVVLFVGRNQRAVWVSGHQHLSPQAKGLRAMPSGLCAAVSPCLGWQRDGALPQFGFLAFSLPWLNRIPPPQLRFTDGFCPSVCL